MGQNATGKARPCHRRWFWLSQRNPKHGSPSPRNSRTRRRTSAHQFEGLQLRERSQRASINREWTCRCKSIKGAKGSSSAAYAMTDAPQTFRLPNLQYWKHFFLLHACSGNWNFSDIFYGIAWDYSLRHFRWIILYANFRIWPIWPEGPAWKWGKLKFWSIIFILWDTSCCVMISFWDYSVACFHRLRVGGGDIDRRKWLFTHHRLDSLFAINSWLNQADTNEAPFLRRQLHAYCGDPKSSTWSSTRMPSLVVSTNNQIHRRSSH